MSFAKKLKALRKEKGVTQIELSKATGISNRMISYYENDAREDALPDEDILYSICKYFEVPMSYFSEGLEKTPLNNTDIMIKEIIDSTYNSKIDWVSTSKIFFATGEEDYYNPINSNSLTSFLEYNSLSLEDIEIDDSYVGVVGDYDIVFLLIKHNIDYNSFSFFAGRPTVYNNNFIDVDLENLTLMVDRQNNEFLKKLLDIIKGDDAFYKNNLIDSIISELRKNK